MLASIASSQQEKLSSQPAIVPMVVQQAEGKNLTYAEARADAKKQLKEKTPGPNMSEHEAECVMKEADKGFEKTCSKQMADKGKFQLRSPGLRGKGLPTTGGGGAVGAL